MMETCEYQGRPSVKLENFRHSLALLNIKYILLFLSDMYWLFMYTPIAKPEDTFLIKWPSLLLPRETMWPLGNKSDVFMWCINWFL